MSQDMASNTDFQPTTYGIATCEPLWTCNRRFLHGRGVVHGDLTADNILLKSAPSNPHGFTAKVPLLTSPQPPHHATLRVTSAADAISLLPIPPEGCFPRHKQNSI